MTTPGAPPPPPPPPGAPGQPPASGQQNNGLGLTAMILGIISIPLACCWIGFVSGIVAVVLGVLGKKKADAGEASNGGQALAGIICGGISVAIGLLWTILSLVGTISVPGV